MTHLTHSKTGDTDKIQSELRIPNVYCVRSNYGTYTKHFVEGGYIAIGWTELYDLTDIHNKEELYPLYRRTYSDDTSNVVIGQQVGQIARFLFDIQPGDYVITPAQNLEQLHVGIVEERTPTYYYANDNDGCPYLHRRHVKWIKRTFPRSAFSVPFQNSIRSSLTVFSVSQRDHFFEIIGRPEFSQSVVKNEYRYNPGQVVLVALLELNDKEFEILATHLLTALGFEAEHTGKSGDGGVDATGELNIANLAKVKIFVQVKRYKPGTKISAVVVKALRQSIPTGGQGAFITTAEFQKAATDIAIEIGFPRIGLINGSQLVDLLVEHWKDIPREFQEKLGLRQWLVRI